MSDDREKTTTSIGVFGWLLFGLSWCLVAVTLPFSLCVLLKVQYSTVHYSTVQYCTALYCFLLYYSPVRDGMLQVLDGGVLHFLPGLALLGRAVRHLSNGTWSECGTIFQSSP